VFPFPPSHGVSHHENLTTFCFSEIFFSNPKKLGARAMVQCSGNTNTGESKASLMTISTVVKQVEGDKYPTVSLVLSLINSEEWNT
jgi:hypothetical protein